MCDGGGGGGGGGRGRLVFWGNFCTGVRASILELIPIICLAFEKTNSPFIFIYLISQQTHKESSNAYTFALAFS